jgi:superfamily II DNA/RNA helicase
MNNSYPPIESLQPFLKAKWEKAGFQRPTEVQSQVIPYVINGLDVMGQSPTGSGKTLAYLLPVLQNIDTSMKNVQAVILASSHELVSQVHGEVQKWCEGSDISSAVMIGSANVKRQIEKLKSKPQIIVATPGRLYELIKMKKLKMHEVKKIVLDEADQLLTKEHLPIVSDIIKTSMSDRQLLVFSATLPEQTEEVARELMVDPVVIRIEKSEELPEVEHMYFVCEYREKIDVLRRLGRLKDMKGIVFVKDIGNLTVLAQKLNFKDLSVGVLHSDANKQERQKALKLFKEGAYPLLLCTDVAARGLDIEGISHVIHYDLPKEEREYVHRSGRTGRLGSTSGTVISIITESEERKLNQYSQRLGFDVNKKIFLKGKIVNAKAPRLENSKHRG